MKQIIFYLYICQLGFECVFHGRLTPNIIDMNKAYNMLKKLEDFRNRELKLEFF